MKSTRLAQRPPKSVAIRHTAGTIEPGSGLLLPTLAFCLSVAVLQAQPTPGSIVTHPLPFADTSMIVDTIGSVYVATGADEPGLATPGAAQTQFQTTYTCAVSGIGGVPIPAPCHNAFLTKADASGSLVYASYLGGPKDTLATGGAIDAAGSLYVVGLTLGSFPTTSNAAIPASNIPNGGGYGSFAAKLSPDGSHFLYSTYLPYSLGPGLGIAVDAQGNAYISGTTAPNGPPGHVFVMKLSADGSAILYTTVLAGSVREGAEALTVDGSGAVVVTGWTVSPDFPVTAGVVQPQLRGQYNAFVTKLDGNGRIIFSTYLGGSDLDISTSVQTDSEGNIYVAGSTNSVDFPTTAGSFQAAPMAPMGGYEGFVTKLAADGGALVYSTYMGYVTRMAVNSRGEVYWAGYPGPVFPVTQSAPQRCRGNLAVAHLDASGAALLDATYLDLAGALGIWGMALSSDGTVLLAAGPTHSVLARIRFGGPGWSAPTCYGTRLVPPIKP